MRHVLTPIAAALLGVALALPLAARAGGVTVYKTPTCGCCKAWVEHLRAAGFEVQVQDLADVTPHKQRLGVPPPLAACHTAVVDGYVVEGHVPATDVTRLLATRPAITGIAVAGMPRGSPGMEYGPAVAYDVIAFKPDGTLDLFASH
jgi:hypothetical protein